MSSSFSVFLLGVLLRTFACVLLLFTHFALSEPTELYGEATMHTGGSASRVTVCRVLSSFPHPHAHAHARTVLLPPALFALRLCGASIPISHGERTIDAVVAGVCVPSAGSEASCAGTSDLGLSEAAFAALAALDSLLHPTSSDASESPFMAMLTTKSATGLGAPAERIGVRFILPDQLPEMHGGWAVALQLADWVVETMRALPAACWAALHQALALFG